MPIVALIRAHFDEQRVNLKSEPESYFESLFAEKVYQLFPSNLLNSVGSSIYSFFARPSREDLLKQKTTFVQSHAPFLLELIADKYFKIDHVCLVQLEALSDYNIYVAELKNGEIICAIMDEAIAPEQQKTLFHNLRIHNLSLEDVAKRQDSALVARFDEKPKPELIAKASKDPKIQQILAQLEVVKEIMTNNIRLAIARGAQLESLLEKSEDLAITSSRFYMRTQELNEGCFYWFLRRLKGIIPGLSSSSQPQQASCSAKIEMSPFC